MADMDPEDKPAAPETAFRPMNDAYTGMLLISFFALAIGCVLLYLDYAQYPAKEPPKVDRRAYPPVGKGTGVEDEGKKDDGKKDDGKKDDGKKDDGKKDDDKKG